MTRRPKRASSAVTPSRRSYLKVPAVRALGIQLAALLLVICITTAIDPFASLPFPYLLAALVQGMIAAALTYRLRLAIWWVGIQVAFPVAAVAMQILAIPPLFYLGAFVFFLGLYWSTFRTQVPFYPSGPATWETVAALLPTRPGLRFIDIGSGLGGLTLHLAKSRPDCEFIGIELAPLPWLASLLRARVSRSKARFLRGDYADVDFSQFDVVFAYLSPVAMPALWEKARAEMCPQALLLSYEFPIAGEKWNIIKTPAEGGPDLYGWRM